MWFPHVVQKQMLGEVKKLTGHLRQVVSEIFVPKKYQNLTIGFQVTVENVENVFFETQCIYTVSYTHLTLPTNREV